MPAPPGAALTVPPGAALTVPPGAALPGLPGAPERDPLVPVVPAPPVAAVPVPPGAPERGPSGAGVPGAAARVNGAGRTWHLPASTTSPGPFGIPYFKMSG